MKNLFIPLAALAFAVSAQAQTITYFNDTFEGTGSTVNNDTVSDTDIAWFSRGNATITVITDSFAGDGGTKALGINPAFGGVVYLGSFDSDVSDNRPGTGGSADDSRVTLGSTVGEYLSLTMDFHFRAAPDASSGFFFGLYGDPTGFVNADNTGTATDDATGYYVRITNSGNAGLFRDGSGTGTILSGGTALGTSTGGSISDQSKHSLELRITRTATGADVEYFLDSTPFALGSDSSPLTSFNLVPIKNDTSTTNYSIDNVVLRAVPEPSSFVMLLGGLGMMALLRRRLSA